VTAAYDSETGPNRARQPTGLKDREPHIDWTSPRGPVNPYGAPTLTYTSGGSGTGQNPYLFKGGIQDRATGFVKFGGRWYDPTTGAWTQQGTLDAPLDPANANRYQYAGDDPISDADPAGQDVDAVGDVVAGVLGAAVGVAVGGAICAATGAETAGAGCVAGALIGGAVGGAVGGLGTGLVNGDSGSGLATDVGVGAAIGFGGGVVSLLA
jgi:RHS repeat-associated protein